MKKLLACLLTLCMLVCALPVAASAVSAETLSGTFVLGLSPSAFPYAQTGTSTERNPAPLYAIDDGLPFTLVDACWFVYDDEGDHIEIPFDEKGRVFGYETYELRLTFRAASNLTFDNSFDIRLNELRPVDYQALSANRIEVYFEWTQWSDTVVAAFDLPITKQMIPLAKPGTVPALSYELYSGMFDLLDNYTESFRFWTMPEYYGGAPLWWTLVDNEYVPFAYADGASYDNEDVPAKFEKGGKYFLAMLMEADYPFEFDLTVTDSYKLGGVSPAYVMPFGAEETDYAVIEPVYNTSGAILALYPWYVETKAEADTSIPLLLTGVTQVKVIDAATEKFLPGAEFALYRISTSGKRTLHATFTTNENGRFTARPLSPRYSYELVMTKAPEGYDLLKSSISFRIQYNEPLLQTVKLNKTPAN